MSLQGHARAAEECGTQRHAAQCLSSNHMLARTGPTFSERCNSPRGRLAVGSVVSHSLKSCSGICLRCCPLKMLGMQSRLANRSPVTSQRSQ